jgi:hypothetical protein
LDIWLAYILSDSCSLLNSSLAHSVRKRV